MKAAGRYPVETDNEIIKLLLNQNANVNAKSYRGLTALDYAIKRKWRNGEWKMKWNEWKELSNETIKLLKGEL